MKPFVDFLQAVFKEEGLLHMKNENLVKRQLIFLENLFPIVENCILFKLGLTYVFILRLLVDGMGGV